MRKRTLPLTAIALSLTLGSALAFAEETRSPIPVAEKKAASKTGIQWAVTPPHVVVFLDGKKLGDAGSLTFTDAKPGKHMVKLTKGADETEVEVKVTKGQVLRFDFEFTDG